MFILELYDKNGFYKGKEEHARHLTAYRSGQNWKMLTKGNSFKIKESKSLSDIEYDIHMDTLLGGFV